ncbi:MAG: MarR family transcriptional regulator [Bacteroidia bacterium]|nr:MarR family transcriptional regulator [Bacteroidia bacterium]
MERQKNITSDQFPIGRHMAILARMYYGALNKKLERLDIDRHYSVLILLDGCDKNCSQKYISEQLLIDKASMVRIMDHLSEKGYIIRTVCATDRREHSIKLTEKAKRIVPKIKKATQELNEKILVGMSKEKKAGFYAALETIYFNLNSEPKTKVTINYKTSSKKK